MGVLFVFAADRPRMPAAAVFAASVVAMLSASALYHRIDWSPHVRPWMRRLDYAGVYLLIAGTYTAVALVSLDGLSQKLVLGIVWVMAAVATSVKCCWIGAPDWLSAVIAVSLGWFGVAFAPQLVEKVGVTGVALLAAGGLAYTAGAVVYARRKPDPIPSTFGYHEVFHALTLVALTCQYVAIAFFVVRVV